MKVAVDGGVQAVPFFLGRPAAPMWLQQHFGVFGLASARVARRMAMSRLVVLLLKLARLVSPLFNAQYWRKYLQYLDLSDECLREVGLNSSGQPLQCFICGWM